MTQPNIRKSPAPFSIPKLSYRVWTVWRRNFDVFIKTIKVNFLPSLFEPILYLAAFGFALGGFIPNLNGQPYINFMAPALVAIAIMNGSFFECTFASFVRMYFQKTFDAIVATPVSVEEVVAGELLWGATRSTINATIVLGVIVGAGFFTPTPLVTSPLFILSAIYRFYWRLTVLLHRHVLHSCRAKHRFLQLPLISLCDANAIFMRNILPLNFFASSGSRICPDSSSSNARCKCDSWGS